MLCLGLIGPVSAQETGTGAAGQAAGGGTVPGVDTVPAAVYPDGDPRKAQAEAAAQEQKQPAPVATRSGDASPANGNNAAPTEASDVRSRFPLIRNIRVETEREYPYSVRIRWDVDPANDTAIYVGRYIRPLATRQLILEAENLTSPPLGPRETSYVDRNIPDGTYYYVVVTTFEMSKRDTVVLQPNVNYTTTPTVIYRGANPNTNTDPNQTDAGKNVLSVSNLFAVNSDTTVKLSWRPPAGRDVSFNVYRSDRALDSPEALRTATRLGVVSDQQYIYEDRDPLVGRQVYYGVSVTDNATQREEQKRYAGVSFVPHTYRKRAADEEVSNSLPDALTAFLASRDTVRLLWVEAPAETVRDYRVYRAARPINTAAALGDAALIGTVAAGDSGYRDAGLRPGTYYYAVLPRDRQGREIRNFTEGRTFTGFAVNIGENQNIPDQTNNTDNGNGDGNEQKKPVEFTDAQRDALKEPAIEFLQAQGGIEQVELAWSVARPELNAFQLLLFRSDKPMQNVKQVREWGVQAARLPGGETGFTDANLSPGRYYYALILDFSDHIQETMTVGRNYLAFPVEVSGRSTNDPEQTIDPDGPVPDDGGVYDPDFDGSLYELNRILALTYHKKMYGEAIRRLAPFVSSRSLAPNIQAKALLYTGLALYHTGQYRNAIDYFLTELVQKYYPDRAEFWYNRSIKRLR